MSTEIDDWAEQLRWDVRENGVLLAALRVVSPDHALEIARDLGIDGSADPKTDQTMLRTLGLPEPLVKPLKLPSSLKRGIMDYKDVWVAWIAAALAVGGVWHFMRERNKPKGQIAKATAISLPVARIHTESVSNRYRLGLVVEAQSLSTLQVHEHLSLERVLPLLRSAKYFICRSQVVANALALQLGVQDFDRASRAFVYVGIDFETQDTGIDAVGFRGALEQRLTSAAGFVVVVVRELLAVQGLQDAGFIQV